jgi:hypothetical protein
MTHTHQFSCSCSLHVPMAPFHSSHRHSPIYYSRDTHKHHAHVRFAKDVIASFSRKPTRFEFFFMNRWEDHSDYCPRCEPILYGNFPRRGLCRRGKMLAGVILRYFLVETDGRVYSTEDEGGCPVQVEISRGYWATHGLLKETYPYSYSRRYAGMFVHLNYV